MEPKDYHLKAILLDIDNTLVDTSKFASTARECAIDSLIIGGLHKDREKITEDLKEIIKKYGSNYEHHFDRILEDLKEPKEEMSRLIAYAVHAYHAAKPILRPFPDVPATLVSLKEKGYLLYAVSEGVSVKQWDKLITSRLDRIIDKALMTEDLSFKSKVPDFYKAVLKKIGLKPHDCVMVGDRAEKDIIPARLCGINTVQVLTGMYNGENNSLEPISEINWPRINRMSELPCVLPEIERKVFEEFYKLN